MIFKKFKSNISFYEKRYCSNFYTIEWVERNLAKIKVEGSNPCARSKKRVFIQNKTIHYIILSK